MNSVILIGRIGKDPELKQTASGQSVCNCSLATSESFKNKAGEKQEKTDWHNLQIWGTSADTFAKWVKKGDRIGIEGKISYRQWDDKDGNKKYATEIIVARFEFLNDKKKDPSNDPKTDNQSAPQYDDSQLPF